jgi:hypothetical protein
MASSAASRITLSRLLVKRSCSSFVNCFLRILSGNDINHATSAAVTGFGRDPRNCVGEGGRVNGCGIVFAIDFFLSRRCATERFLETGKLKSLGAIEEEF